MIVVQSGKVSDELRGSGPMALVRSLMTRTSNQSDYSGWKVPGTMTRNEVDTAGLLDAKQGGFGPFFSLALLWAFAGALAALWSARRKGLRLSQARISLLVCVGVLTFSAAIHGESWWARLIPFFYSVAVVLSVLALSFERLRIPRTLAVLALLSLSLNGGIAFWSARMCVFKRGVKTGYREDQKVLAVLPLDTPVVAVSGSDMGFAGVYHLKHDLGLDRVTYARPSDAPWCNEETRVAYWLKSVQICVPPR